MEFPTDGPVSAPTAAAARRALLGFGAREIGVGAIALAVLTAAGVWYHRRSNQDQAELQDIRRELAVREDAAEVYRDRFQALNVAAAQIRTWAEMQPAEPLRTWARERARRFDAFVARVNREGAAALFAASAKELEHLCADGNLASAKDKLATLPTVTFPSPSEFARLRRELFETPLARFSRENPDYYRAFRQFEPEAEKKDEAVLRSEIARAGADGASPQLMLQVDLLAAVAARDDPTVAEWSTMASALDYFENPDSTVLGHWRGAQRALQLKDWQTAVNEMQAIVDAKTRVRQPFRAAYGRVLIHSRPADPVAARPFVVEAAAGGDKQARAWLAAEDYREGRYADAQHWIEAGIADGETDGIPILIRLYEKHAREINPDTDRQIGVLERVTDREDAPADASLLLGRLYEQRDPAAAAKAYAAYVVAAAKGSGVANAEVARCDLKGIGTAADPDAAREAACRAFAAGERERAAPILIDLMRQSPERTSGAVLHLFEQEQVAGRGGYRETRVIDGPGVSALKGQLARYLDGVGQYGQAARFYSGSRDPAAIRRRAELFAGHACETCGGTGKIQVSITCPTCGGKGKQICSYCGGTGYIYVPGTPPCPTCGGTGSIVQDRKLVVCGACGGTGKGKGSVIKQDCPHCDHGYIRCTECDNGLIKVTRECPDCHGKGTWTLVDRSPGEGN